MHTAAYSDRLKAHLATYKRGRLGVTENGAWRSNSKEQEHVLQHYQTNGTVSAR